MTAWKRTRPRVVYWNNIPAPYMVERFNAVASRGNLDFEAWFNDRLEADRSWAVDEKSWKFRYRYLPRIVLGRRTLHLPLPIFQRKKPDLLVSLYAEPAFLTGWAIAKMRGVRTAFWCEVTMDRWVKRYRWKERLKDFIFPRVDALLGSGEDSRRFAMRYGATAEQAMSLPHSIDVQHYMVGRERGLETRDELRSTLGLKGVTFIYVGRLWWGKGLEFLIDAFGSIQQQMGDEVSLMLVGDGEEEAALRRRCQERGVENVVFTGFQQKPDLPRYYAAADVFVFPTLGDPYGLVVDEAMAASLPIISSTSAGEITDRVEDGVNGYLVPPEDSEALSAAMKQLVRNPNLRTKMGASSAARISGHTPEWWAENFEATVQRILA